MNRKRNVYYLYFLVFSLVYGALFVWASYNVQDENAELLLLIIGIIMLVVEPIALSYVYRNIKQDGGANSDERESVVVQKSLANTGVTAISLGFIPYLASFVFPDLMPYVSFGYIALLGAIFKTSVVYYNNKI